jgi:hypothetical protein
MRFALGRVLTCHHRRLKVKRASLALFTILKSTINDIIALGDQYEEATMAVQEG